MLLSFFWWCEQTSIGEAIRHSLWLFPVIEAIHLVGLGVIAGAVLVVDLRLLGLGLNCQPVEELAEEAEPWLIGSLAVMLVSGSLMFLSEAQKCYYSVPFWIKMTSLFLVILFTFTWRRHVVRTSLSLRSPLLGRATALVSLGLWFGVGWGRRWIGLS